MGARLVGAALNPHWSARLNSTELVVLVTMSLTARDLAGPGQPAGVYWGGHEYLALTITGQEPTPSSVRMVRRCIAKLVEVGAVEVTERASGRRRGRYQITTGSFGEVVPLPVDNQQTTPPPAENRGTPVSSYSDAQCPPIPPIGGHLRSNRRAEMSSGGREGGIQIEDTTRGHNSGEWAQSPEPPPVDNHDAATGQSQPTSPSTWPTVSRWSR